MFGGNVHKDVASLSRPHANHTLTTNTLLGWTLPHILTTIFRPLATANGATAHCAHAPLAIAHGATARARACARAMANGQAHPVYSPKLVHHSDHNQSHNNTPTIAPSFPFGTKFHSLFIQWVGHTIAVDQAEAKGARGP
eukprot:TRINITY_DN67111_c0_g3_i2.p1 TRINITY_DN67111_c0_g3~~TRINITY_DN67111_c0_g3_i2.p1  ORF type:complete len:140 (+),score=15.48 TRINITY_DN67111_c0_g3_i2:231-650(+)